ncbi:MAG: phosphate ABC transporter substrate-binding protein PstS family protein [Actinomycetota bacterium]
MRSVNGRPWRLLLLALVFALVAAACGVDDEEIGATSSGGSENGAAVAGEVVVSGSSTVEPISALNAEKFQGANPEVSISVDGPGTGDGFELFCAGETDISDASRPIEEEEIAACEDAGIEFVEIKVAYDGMAVMSNPANDAVTCLDFLDLYALIGPESEGFENWSDANDLAAEIKAPNAPYPDAPLDLVGPGQESGTYDSFAEIALEGFAVDERGQNEDGPFTRQDYQSSPNDNVIIQGIEGSNSSLGWVGYAFAVEAGDGVKVLEVSNDAEGAGCTAPSDEAIADGSYPLSRSLYIYVNSAKAQENEAVSAYVDYYLSADGLASVAEVGYVDLPEDQLAGSQSAWEAMETGTREG